MDTSEIVVFHFDDICRRKKAMQKRTFPDGQEANRFFALGCAPTDVGEKKQCKRTTYPGVQKAYHFWRTEVRGQTSLPMGWQLSGNYPA
jgi:hypothetical protein